MQAFQPFIDMGNALADTADSIAVTPLCDAFGRPPDQIRIFVIFLLQYPMGWAMHYLVHGTYMRHLYAICLGIPIQLYLYGTGIVHVFLMAGVAYAMMNFLPRHKQAPYVMFWVLGYLSYSHLCALIYNFGGYEMDITSYTMLLVCKLSALAYCFQDGMTDADFLNQDQRDRMVLKMPSPLEFASYVWYCQACALGVFFEFSDYKRFIERSHEYKDVPSPIIPSLKWLGTGTLCLVFFTLMVPTFNVEFCWDEKFLNYFYLYRVFYYFVAMTVKRFFYYNPFCMSTGAIVASGLGYNGMEKGEHKWDKIVSIYILGVETASSPIEMLRFWNHQVHLWLKFYIMARLTPHGKRPGAFENMATFIVSAFWHGFYPFYYVMFFFAAVLSEVAKDIYKSRYLFRFIPEATRPFLANTASFLCMNYLGILQCALTFENGNKFLLYTWGLVPVSLLTILTFSRTFGLVRYAQKLQAKAEGKESAPSKVATPEGKAKGD